MSPIRSYSLDYRRKKTLNVANRLCRSIPEGSGPRRRYFGFGLRKFSEISPTKRISTAIRAGDIYKPIRRRECDPWSSPHVALSLLLPRVNRVFTT